MSNEYDSFTHLIQRAPVVITGATSGAQQVVAPVAGKKNRLLGYKISAVTACSLKFQAVTAGGSRDLTGLIVLAAGERDREPTNPYGFVETVSGEGLAIHTSAAAAIGGVISFLQF
jgi:hypothetical protein